MTLSEFGELATQIDEAFLLIGFVLLIIEIAELAFKGSLRGRSISEMLVSVSTQVPTLLVETTIMTFAYAAYWALHQGIVTWPIPTNWWGLLLALIVADFIYYWEHRIAHQVRILWTQHAVHHSSRDLNIATALKFGPLEGLWSFIAYLPMVFIGFAPEVVVASAIIVLGYQTWLHTELIGKLGPLEWVLNTPSHHRVHHGCDQKYLDRNYGAVFIVWDRLFDTFQLEEERPRYGLVGDFDSQNPLRVWFSELPSLWRDLRNANSVREVWLVLFEPPGGKP